MAAWRLWTLKGDVGTSYLESSRNDAYLDSEANYEDEMSHGEDESLDDSLCPCGRKTPRIGVTQGAALERRVASYAR